MLRKSAFLLMISLLNYSVSDAKSLRIKLVNPEDECSKFYEKSILSELKSLSKEDRNEIVDTLMSRYNGISIQSSEKLPDFTAPDLTVLLYQQSYGIHTLAAPRSSPYTYCYQPGLNDATRICYRTHGQRALLGQLDTGYDPKYMIEKGESLEVTQRTFKQTRNIKVYTTTDSRAFKVFDLLDNEKAEKWLDSSKVIERSKVVTERYTICSGPSLTELLD